MEEHSQDMGGNVQPTDIAEQSQQSEESPRVLTCAEGHLIIDRAGYDVRLDGNQLTLAPKLFELLRCLVDHDGAVVMRYQLLEEVWHTANWYGSTKTIDVHVASLRKALGSLGSHIQTVRGRGYKWVEDLKEAGATVELE